MSDEFILKWSFNPLSAELNPICHLSALLGAHHILHVGRIRVKGLRLIKMGHIVATGRVCLAGQDKGERSDEERYPGPPGWGLRRRTSTPTHAKMFLS